MNVGRLRLHATAAILAAFGIFGLSLGHSAEARAARARNGAAIYASACVSCHGPDGQGTALPTRGFSIEPPDLTDCNFASREAKADWATIVREGGPARGFDAIMPAFGDELSPEEIAAVVEYARRFCDEPAWPQGDLNFPRPIFTEKAFVEDEVVLTTGVLASRQGRVSNKLVIEKRFLARWQAEAIVPFAWIEGDDGVWRGGIGDVALGGKAVLFSSTRSGSILGLACEAILPTGNADRGLGAGTTRFEPFVSFGQRLPGPFFLHLQAGAEIPVNRDRAAVEVFWRAAVGANLRFGRFDRGIFPAIEVLGAREIEDEATVAWDLVPQLQVPLNRRQHLRLSVGVRVPLTDMATRRPEILAFFLWDFFDGSPADGW